MRAREREDMHGDGIGELGNRGGGGMEEGRGEEGSLASQRFVNELRHGTTHLPLAFARKSSLLMGVMVLYIQ